jgi:hypothetical protein
MSHRNKSEMVMPAEMAAERGPNLVRAPAIDQVNAEARARSPVQRT